MCAKPDEQLVSLFKDATGKANDRLRSGLFTFVVVSVFLCIAVLSTSHRDLLTGKTLHLPVVDVDLPLTSFYILAPLVYLALHLALLAQALHAVERLAQLAIELRGTGGIGDIDTARLQVIRLTVWVMAPLSLVRHPDEHGPPHALAGLAARLFGALPFTFVPLGLLALFCQRFLAYQSMGITALHLAVILADAAAIAWTWHRLGRPLLEVAGVATDDARTAGLKRSLGLVPSAALILALAWVAEIPVLRWLNDPWPRIDLRGGGLSADRARTDPSVDHELLEKRVGLLLRNDDPAPKLEAADMELLQRSILRVPERRDLKGRSLRGAKLAYADLAGADLSGADLTGADLRFADLRAAILAEADLDGALLEQARLEFADLTGAKLRKASAPFARFEGAILHGADLTEADLRGAHLQFLSFAGPGVTADGGRPGLGVAVMRAAILTGAQFHGTPLGKLVLHQADLREAQLVGVLSVWGDKEAEDANFDRAAISQPGSVGGDDAGRQKIRRATADGKPGEEICGIRGFEAIYYDAALVLREENWEQVARLVGSLRQIEPTPCPDQAGRPLTAQLGPS